MPDQVVALNGNDITGTGSSANPWATWAKALTLVGPGDTIFGRGGAFAQRIYASAKNGTAGNPITLKAWPGETVTIKGVAGSLGCILLSNCDYIVIDGLTPLWDYTLIPPDWKMSWVRFDTSSAHCTIKNFYIERQWLNTNGSARTLDQEYADERNIGISVAAGCDDISIEDGEILGINKGIQFNGISTNCTVRRVYVHGTVQSPVDVQNGITNGTGYSGLKVEDCVLESSYIEDGFQTNDSSGTGLRTNRGIILRRCDLINNRENAIDLKASDSVLVEHCRVRGTWGSNNGSLAASGNNRNSFNTMTVGGTENGDNVILRHSVFYDNCNGIDPEFSWAIYNNTIIWHKRDYTGSNSSYDGAAAAYPPWTGITAIENGVTKDVLRNNLIANMASCAVVMRSPTSIDSDYNCYAGQGNNVGAVATGTSWAPKTLAEWRTYLSSRGAPGADTNSFQLANVAACGFVNVPEQPSGAFSQYDFGLEVTSPLKGAGGPLAFAVGAGTNSTSLVVNNVAPFFDGFGRSDEVGDTIYIAGAGARVITGTINRTTNTIPLNTAASWADGAAVWFGDAATADIGANLSASEPPPDPPPAASNSQGVITATARTSLGEQTFDFPVAPVAVIIRCSIATVAGTPANHATLSLGLVTANEQYVIGERSTHNLAATDTDRRSSSSACIQIINATNSAVIASASVVSLTGTVLTVNWTTAAPAAYRIDLEWFAGSAASAKLVSVAQTINGVTAIPIAHAWRVAILLGTGKAFDLANANAWLTMGLGVKSAGAITQNAYGWYSVNNVATPQLVARLFTNRLGGHVLTDGGVYWGLELQAGAGNDANLYTRTGTPSDPEQVPILFIDTDVDLWTGIITLPSGAGAVSYQAPNFPANMVQLLATLLTAADTGATDGTAGAFALATLSADSYSLAYSDRDGTAPSRTQVLSTATPLTLPHDGGSTGLIADSWATLATGFSLNYTAGAPGLAIALVWGSGGGFELTGSDLTAGSPVLEAPTLAQTHVLVGTDLTTGAPALEAPTVAQMHALAATSLTAGAPVLEAPTLAQTHVLTGSDLTTGAPVLDSPSLISTGDLIGTDLTAGAPILDAPTLGQTHVLTATDLTGGVPALEAPTFAQTHALVATDLATGAPALEAPTAAQTHALLGADLTTDAPDLEAGSLGQTHILLGADLETGAPVLELPILTLNLAVGVVTVLFRVRKAKVRFRSGG